MVSIRTCTTVNAHGEWGLFFLHRERGLTRFYVQLNRGDEAEVPKESITLKLIVQGLQHLLRPYTVSTWANGVALTSLMSALDNGEALRVVSQRFQGLFH